jgi:hypothetical protein
MPFPGVISLINIPVPPYRPPVARLKASDCFGDSSSLYGSFNSRTKPRAAFSYVADAGSVSTYCVCTSDMTCWNKAAFARAGGS